MELKLNSIHFTDVKKYYLYISLILLLIIQLFFVANYWQEKQQIIYFIPIITLYSILHFYIYKKNTFTLKHILWVSVPVHFMLIFTSPFLSDDIYRYIWDGIVSSNGINPYTFSPEYYSDFGLAKHYGFYHLINHSQYSTLYLPIPEAIFWFSNLFSTSVISIKLITFFSFLVSLKYIIKIDQVHQLKNTLTFVFSLHPLIIYEVSSSAHLDGFYMMSVIVGYYFYLTSEKRKSISFFVLSVFTRPISLIYLIYFKYTRKILVPILLISLSFFYYYLTTLPESGLNAYSSDWYFNHPLFSFLREVGMTYYHEINSMLSYNSFIKLVSILFIIIIFIKPFKRITSFEQFIITSHLFLTFLSPTIYPWYLISLIPFCVITKQDSILIYLYTVLLSYYVIISYFSDKIWQESLWIIAFEYGIPLLYFLLKEIKKLKSAPIIQSS